MQIQLRVQGAKHLQGVLSTLEPKLQQQVWRRALLAGARVIRNRARAMAPVRTGDTRPRRAAKGQTRGPGFLKRNIIAKVLRNRRNGQLVAIAGTKGDAFYGRLIETGWTAGGRRRATLRRLRTLHVAERGSSRVAPRPWLRPAFHGAHQEALNAVGEALRAGLAGIIEGQR